MRSLVGLFGVLCGVIAVALVARYGFKTADNDVDGLITAFLFATIAAGGLGGHAVAARLWRTQKAAGALVGVVCGIALVINLSNSLGFIAGRGDQQQAERTKAIATARANRDEIVRKIAERKSLGDFPATDAATVKAAERAADTATATRIAECTKRGPLCRQREAEETLKATELATATAHKATTDRAANLDREIARLNEALATATPVVAVNPHQAAIGRLFRLPEETAATAATWQQFALSAVVELLIVVSLVAWEILRHAKPAPADREPRVEVVIPEPVEAAQPAKMKPRLVASDPAPVGSVPDIMADALEPADGLRVEIEDAYRAYTVKCKAIGKRPVTPEHFIEAMEVFCRECRVQTEMRGRKIYLVDVSVPVPRSVLSA
jgi:hypothetical protein